MSSTQPLPVVLVGCGAVSQLFYSPALQTLQERGELTVAALVDPSEKARQVLEERFPRAVAAKSLAEVHAPKGSLAIVASPPKFHALQVIEALRLGWHVLCEKPMAATSAECDQMIAAAEETGNLLAVGQYKRFFPSSQVLRTLLSGGTPLGPLQSFFITEGGPFGWPAASESFFRRTETPGGVLLDIGIHVLDLLLWWLGEPAEYTYADDSMGGMEINVLLDLKYPGAYGRVHLSRDWATRQRYEFRFAHGRVAWTVNDANGLVLELENLPAALSGRLVDALDAPLASNPQSFIVQLQNVAQAIRTGTPVFVDGREGSRALRFIEACYARKTLLTQPWLTPAEATRAAELAR